MEEKISRHSDATGVDSTSREAASMAVSQPHPRWETHMSKGLDKKREAKKKPARTLEEKRAAKKGKKAQQRPFIA
jgi:hypothetical protein